MRPLVLALAVSAAALTGCAGAVHTVSPDGGLADLSREVAGRSVTVVLRSRAQHAGHSLLLAPDTTTWTEGETGRQLAVPTAGIAQVHVRDRGRAVGRSVGLGAALGGGLGLAAGLSVPAAPIVKSLLTTFFVGTGAVAGSLYGLIGGAADGRPERYVLAPFDGQAQGGAFEVPPPAASAPPAPVSGPPDGPPDGP